MSGKLGRTAAIVAAAETDRIGTLPGMSRLGLHAQAARNALTDAGLTLAGVDGRFCTPPGPNELSECLGVVPRYVDGTGAGGLSYGHSGRYGMFAQIEAVVQLHGEAGARQMARLRTSLVHGTGHFKAPTVLSDGPADARFLREERFGPVDIMINNAGVLRPGMIWNTRSKAGTSSSPPICAGSIR